MPDEHTLTLQDIAPVRDWRLANAGAHYRELAAWLRDRASACHLPYPQRGLLSLAKRYECRAERFERRARVAWRLGHLLVDEI